MVDETIKRRRGVNALKVITEVTLGAGGGRRLFGGGMKTASGGVDGGSLRLQAGDYMRS